MGKMRKIRLLIGVKGILSIACLTTVALALVVYTASVTMTPKFQFSQGATADTWDLYLNEVDQVRYMPGGVVAPSSPLETDPNSYAFEVVTDGNKVCAVAINIAEAVSSKFVKFDVRVKYWDSVASAWLYAELFESATGSASKAWINGLDVLDVGYIHQELSLTRFYLVEVTYTYDINDESDFLQETAMFEFTPYAASGF
jgi:hypothetical protein